MAVLASWLLPGCGDYYGAPCAHPVSHVWSIRVENHTDEVFEIDLDGSYLTTLAPWDSTRTDALEAHHVLEAWDVDGELRARREFYLGSDFVWVLEY
jgi:hypothetical protein